MCGEHDGVNRFWKLRTIPSQRSNLKPYFLLDFTKWIPSEDAKLKAIPIDIRCPHAGLGGPFSSFVGVNDKNPIPVIGLDFISPPKSLARDEICIQLPTELLPYRTLVRAKYFKET